MTVLVMSVALLLAVAQLPDSGVKVSYHRLIATFATVCVVDDPAVADRQAPHAVAE